MRTGSPDINKSAVVRVVSLGITNGGGTDGDDGGGAGRGVVGSIVGVVAGTNDGGDTRGDEVGGSSVDRSEETTAQAQGNNRRATSGSGSTADPVKSGDTVGNVDAGSKVTPPRGRKTHTSDQAPILWNVRVRQIDLEETGKVRTRYRSRP